MENFVVKVKRPVGRPTITPDTPDRIAKRKRDREAKARQVIRYRNKILEYGGGECKVTGTTDELEFHHLRPSEKSFDVSHVMSHSMEDLMAEADKCALICAEIHRKIHIELERRMAPMVASGLYTPAELAAHKDLLCERITMREIKQKGK